MKSMHAALSNYNTCKLSADIASLISGELQTCLKSCRRNSASSTASAAKKSEMKMKINVWNDLLFFFHVSVIVIHTDNTDIRIRIFIHGGVGGLRVAVEDIILQGSGVAVVALQQLVPGPVLDPDTEHHPIPLSAPSK